MASIDHHHNSAFRNEFANPSVQQEEAEYGSDAPPVPTLAPGYILSVLDNSEAHKGGPALRTPHARAVSPATPAQYVPLSAPVARHPAYTLNDDEDDYSVNLNDHDVSRPPSPALPAPSEAAGHGHPPFHLFFPNRPQD
ncbi:hypothetical protein BLNAU_21212 [Blattamonas nauphoetae]|uniref:Uncharacterized protein n=1 Tax=Blattamonas nauphoetae TaxID=2049346 RepID=A0ABQ9WWH0_9EUKA|nr:hypothetical protein BLNAU_21212 [Blattamonas nauphoetae]